MPVPHDPQCLDYSLCVGMCVCVRRAGMLVCRYACVLAKTIKLCRYVYLTYMYMYMSHVVVYCTVLCTRGEVFIVSSSAFNGSVSRTASNWYLISPNWLIGKGVW